MTDKTTDLIRSIERWSGLNVPARVSTSRSGLAKQTSLAALQLVTPAIIDNYVCGTQWLERMSGQLDAPNGPIVVSATRGNQFVAVAVLRPKGVHRLKLATFFVVPSWRGRRVATTLAQQVTAGAFDAGYERISLTCPHQIHRQFSRALVPSGFEYVDRLSNRYGDRAESVFCATV